MAYTYKNQKGQTYFLHSKEVELQNGRKQRIYYFGREQKPAEVVNAMPIGYRVQENERTGLPFLKKA